MPVLWPVISSLHAPRSRMGRIAVASSALYMLLVRPREQQVVEKPYGEHLNTSCIISNTFLYSTLLCSTLLYSTILYCTTLY